MRPQNLWQAIGRALSAAALVVVLPSALLAQSAINGTVRDTSGAVLPGVTVEASSPVLIEKVRSVITNDGGQYSIVDLRPGEYKVTFTLTGFSTFIREGMQLPSDFTATVNAEMRVGALEETVTVSGQSPTVDVASTARVQVLNADTIDQIPVGRSIFSIGQLVTGVSLNVPDVGGSRAMQQTYMATRGLTSANNIVSVDGLMINGLDGDGAVQQYINQAMVQEMTFQTAGAGADISPGGVRVNIIPNDGGNQFRGSLFAAYTPGTWQSNNLTDRLKNAGVRAVDRIDHIYDIDPAFGGPIKRDRLWFFSSARFWSVYAPIADTFVRPSGFGTAPGVAARELISCQNGTITCEQGVDDQKIKSAMARLTWQISPKHKFSAYFDEIDKARGHGMNAGNDPLTASQIWTSPMYSEGVAKLTSTLSSRLLLEAGFSINHEQYVIVNQPGVNKDAFTSAWYAGASRRDQGLGTLVSGFGSAQGGRYPDRYNVLGAVSYVTGSHNVKMGMQTNWGPYVNTRETNADLQQVYTNGAPTLVTVYNTPIRKQENLVADVGLFAQDQWTLNRLTLNGGIRWEYMKSEVAAAESGAGRFIGARRFDAIPMPVWKDIAPRFGAIYDVFGNAKTALKVGINRYNESRTTQFAERYNPLQVLSANLSWTDSDGDDIADGELGCSYLTAGCEINFAQLPATFGTPRLNTVDPDFKRTYNVEITGGVQHELFPNVSMNANFYRRDFHRLRLTDNLLRTQADYVAYSVYHPITGQPLTVYDVTAAALTRVQNFDTNAGSGRKHVYTGFDLNVNARLGGGATVFGGFVTERNLRNVCDEPDDPNALLYCDDWRNDIPFRPTLKLSGAYPLPAGFSISAAFQSNAGRPLGGFAGGLVTDCPGIRCNRVAGPGYGDVGSPIGTEWPLTNTTRYPADCPAPCPAGQLVFPGTARLTSAQINLPLAAPGTEFLPRINQLDLSFAKAFTFAEGKRVQAQFDIFNVFNKDTETAYRDRLYGLASYRQPSTVLQGRMIRLSTQVRW
jgi:hypothetical protein